MHTCDSKNELFGLSGIDVGNDIAELPIPKPLLLLELLLPRALPRVLPRVLPWADGIAAAAFAEDADAGDAVSALAREEVEDDDEEEEEDDDTMGEIFEGVVLEADADADAAAAADDDERPPSSRRIAAAARSTEAEMPRNA